ncbi:MAG: hypothetical protein JST62_08715 [Bacteroidetes bacterium]|nr:hypothetical protein [Bacteroidota bacterium]
MYKDYFLKAVTIAFITPLILMSCQKTVGNLLVNSKDKNCNPDTTLKMDVNGWSYYSYATSAIVPQTATTFFNDADTLVGLGQAYRQGGRFQTTNVFNIKDKVLYIKWKLNSGGQFAGIIAQLKYDPTTTDSNPPIQNVDFLLHSTTGFDNSVIIQDNVWYYTRIAANAGTDNYTCTTSINNYSNNGGTVIGSKTTIVYTKSGYLGLRMGDCYGGTSAKFMLSEYKIASN